MEIGKGEATDEPPLHDKYHDRLNAAVLERTIELKGFKRALNDVLDDGVNSKHDVCTLIEAAKRQLAEKHPRDMKLFLFSYVEELEKITARLANKRYEGKKYDA